MSVDFSVSARQRLVDSLNRSNNSDPYTLAVTDVLFGTPVTVNLNNRNTRVLATGASGRYTLSRTLMYNRHPLSRYFSAITTPVIPAARPSNSAELLPILLATKNLQLDEDDIIIEAITGTNSYELRAAPTSLGWTGSVVLTFAGTPLLHGFALDSGALLQTDSGASFILDDDIIPQ